MDGDGERGGDREVCVCTILRQATRSITQRYDLALEAAGVTITGFSLLSRIERLKAPSINELAEEIAMDRTTLTRNLEPLVRTGLVASAAGEDRRRRVLTLTAEGRRTLQRARPRWQTVQREFRAQFGADDTSRLVALLSRAGLLQ